MLNSEYWEILWGDHGPGIGSFDKTEYAIMELLISLCLFPRKLMSYYIWV